MTVTAGELARRLRSVREACRMRQEDAARRIGVSRSALVQLEAGRRSVSSLELDRLAYLYGRTVGDFLTDAFSEENPVTALFRLDPDLAKDDSARKAVQRSTRLVSAITDLEEILGSEPRAALPPGYELSAPEAKWVAVKQGERVAVEERNRLGCGDVPLPDLANLLEAEGIRTAQEDLPEGISGLTLIGPPVGTLVVVRAADSPLRKRFSFAHEYAHVLFDRGDSATVSRAAARETLPEVRANAFAAGFLMPRRGVERFIGSLGKGLSSREQSQVFDEEATLRTEGRPAPGSQEIQIHDIALLSHHFGVSRQAGVYRLRNLGLMSRSSMERLQDREKQGLGRRIAELLGLEPPDSKQGAPAFRRRFLALGFEALRRGKISRGKLRELARSVGTGEEELEAILEDVGLGRPPVDVTLSER